MADAQPSSLTQSFEKVVHSKPVMALHWFCSTVMILGLAGMVLVPDFTSIFTSIFNGYAGHLSTAPQGVVNIATAFGKAVGWGSTATAAAAPVAAKTTAATMAPAGCHWMGAQLMCGAH